MHDTHLRFGPLWLAEGVWPRHVATCLFGAFLGVSLTTFISAINPYVLTVQLGLPVAEQGRVSGQMVFYSELVLLSLSAVVGVWSDRIGRRPVFVAGVLVLAVGYLAYGYVSTVGQLTAVRVFLAFGIVAVNVMVGTIMTDYPQEHSRGKLAGASGIAIGFGAMMIGLVLLPLPAFFAERGVDAIEAGRLTMFTMAALALLLALALQAGLKGGRPSAAASNGRLAALIAAGLAAGRDNRRIRLAYLCAFVARADLVVVGTFYMLWLTQAGIAAGSSPEGAARVAGQFFGLVMLSALIWAPLMGWLNDRLDRIRAMALSMLLAAGGYTAMGLITDPLGVWMYPAAALLGIGQMSAVTASQTLIGQEAPPAQRGAVVGMFTFFGVAGILFITSVGGRIYDAIAPAAPFVLIGVLNASLFLWALTVRPHRREEHS
jgi:MFS family permease